MPVIARDVVAADHLVYAWPFPIGPEEYEVACGQDELVVMCPSWIVGPQLGPGRHRFRTPDPTRPVSAYFVLTAPVEASFDLITQFHHPATGQPVRLRAAGGLQIRCVDASLLVAQFVGLPFDQINEGVLKSVSRSIERMLGRLLTRRVVMAGTTMAVTDPQMTANIVEELVAYNPAAGAVFGVDLVRVGHLQIAADDGSRPWQQMFESQQRLNGDFTGPRMRSSPEIPVPVAVAPSGPTRRASTAPIDGRSVGEVSGEIGLVRDVETPSRGTPVVARSGEIPLPREKKQTMPGHAAASAMLAPTATPPTATATEGAILGIGMAPIGASQSKPAIKPPPLDDKANIAPGGRVLVPGPNGLMQSATVRQLLSGYYELEVGGSGETIWVPMNGVVPE